MGLLSSLSPETLAPVRTFECNFPASTLSPEAAVELDPAAIQAAFLATLSNSIADGDWERLNRLFIDDCFLKDHLAISGGLRTLRSKNTVLKALRTLCPLAGVASFTPSYPTEYPAKVVRQEDGFSYIDFAATFQTRSPPADCTAWIKLVCISGDWKDLASWQAWLFFTCMNEIVGHEAKDLLAAAPQSIRRFAETGLFPEEEQIWPLSLRGAPGKRLYDAERKRDSGVGHDTYGRMYADGRYGRYDVNPSNGTPNGHAGKDQANTNVVSTNSNFLDRIRNDVHSLWQEDNCTESPDVNNKLSLWTTPRGLPEEQRFDVMVVGSGQAGLGVAAQAKANGLSYVVFDKLPCVGDSWRRRYDRARFHLIKNCSHLPFLPYPQSAGTFLHRHEIADQLERYVDLLELNVYTSCTVRRLLFDEGVSEWTASVRYEPAGEMRQFKASHVVWATGGGGQVPRYPDFRNPEVYRGQAVHSVHFSSAQNWAGKSGIIVGSANTAMDIAEDMLENGIKPIVMVQRSATNVVPAEYIKEGHLRHYGEGMNIGIADQRVMSLPFPFTRKFINATNARGAAREPDRFSNLEKAGFLLDREGDLMENIYDKGGGHYVDVGCCQRIIDGEIQMKNDSPVVAYTPTGLEFADGSCIDADLIVLCTGFRNKNARLELHENGLLDALTSEKLKDVWKLNPEGEVRSMWTSSGHRAFWFAGGDVTQARYYSRILVLQIKLRLLGLRIASYPFPAPK